MLKKVYFIGTLLLLEKNSVDIMGNNMKISKEDFKQKFKPFLKKWLGVILNPRLLLCLFIAWMITNGWCYVFLSVGTAFGITWMTVAGGAYAGFLWLPFTPEKIVTLIIAIFLMKLFFPNDEKTIGTLKADLEKLKAKVRLKRNEKKEKKAAKKLCDKNKSKAANAVESVIRSSKHEPTVMQ